MKKHRQYGKQSEYRRRVDRDRRRIHTLACNEARAKGVRADTGSLLAVIERKYADGDISKQEYHWGLSALGIEEEKNGESTTEEN